MPGSRPFFSLAFRFTAGCATVLAAGCAATQPAGDPRAPLQEGAAASATAWSTIGESVEGRPLQALTLGSGGPRIYLVGCIHGNEREGAETLTALLEALRGDGAPAAGTWRILRDMNPDGSARRMRGNANGVDLNRNWPASNFRARASHGAAPLSEPETRAAAADMEAFGADLVVVFHSTADGPFVNFDGPGRALAEVFAEAAQRRDDRWAVVADVGYATRGSLGSFVGLDGGVPILTVEFRRGERSPGSTESALLGVLATAESLAAVARAGATAGAQEESGR